MGRRKSIESYDEDIKKVEENIIDLQNRMKDERRKLKALEEGKRAEQGTILLEKFWKLDIKDFGEIEEVIDDLVKEGVQPKEESNASEEND